MTVLDPHVGPVLRPGDDMADTTEHEGAWTFLTNHTHVLICLARDPRMRIRDLAEAVGITERAVQTIVNDLETAGCINRTRVGRRNHYEVIRERPMRHQVERHHSVGDLLDAMAPEGPDGPSG